MKKFIIFNLIFGFVLINPSLALAASLKLVPSSGTANIGCDFTVNIELDTAGSQTDGTDAILKYDASKLTAKSITSGTIYPDYPGNNIDSQAGRITVSGLASVAQAFSGKGVLATINFGVPAAATVGSTAVTFDFDPSNKTKTTDSNVVERNTIVDVLSSVVDGNYTISTGSCSSQGVLLPSGQAGQSGQGSIATPSGTKTYVPGSSLPPAGSEQLTYTVLILGVALTFLGIMGLILL